MKYVDLTKVTDIEVIDYNQLCKKHTGKCVVVEVSEELGKEIKKEEIEGKYTYKFDGDKYMALDIDNIAVNMIECESHPIAFNWLRGHFDDEEVKAENIKERESKKIQNEYLYGVMPHYFDVEDINVNGSLLKIDFESESLKNKLTTHEDGTQRARIYWDYCEKYLKLCGCKNIDMDEIMCRDDYRIYMDILVTLNSEKTEGILSVTFNDEYVNQEVVKNLAEKGIKAPIIDKEFILKKKFELANKMVFEVTEIDFC